MVLVKFQPYMKILLILFVFLLSCKENKIDAKNVEVNSVSKGTIINKQEPKNISGTWIYEKKSDSKIPEEMFTLKIIQTGDKIKAEYCAISNSGGKIDCDNDENFNVNGVIKNGKIFGEFYSFFGVTNDKGEFKIIINDDNTLEWSIIKAPKGEYYAPNNAILSRKSSLDNISEKININSKNYKGSDITMQLYKEIIENYGCGENSVNGKILGKQNNFELFIIENDCGDFPFKDLLSVKYGKIIDKLNIESSSFDIEKSERDNIQDKTEITFNINNTTNINILSIHSINDKILNKTSTSYELNTQGKFVEK